jgi:hypothetical protein
VEQYLKDYKLCDTRTDRMEKFECFIRYLLSTCYPKIRRRLLNEFSKLLFQALESITGPRLEERIEDLSFPESTKSTTGDIRLCQVVCSAMDPAKIDLESMVRDRKRVDYEQASSLSGGLFQAISTTFEAQAQRLNPPVVTPPLYTRQTFVDFHYLLLVALNGYKTAIQKIHNRTERKSEECLELEIYTHLLWRLANSSILKTHLLFIQKLSLMPGHIFWGGTKSEVEAGGNSDSSEDVEEGDEVEAEMEAIKSHGNHQEDPGLMVQRWICLLVSHFQALKVLSTFSSSHSPEVQIKHVAVRATRFDTPQDWTAVLERARSSRPLEKWPHEAESLILEKLKQVAKTPGRKGIYDYFQDKNIIRVGGQVHCEAGLVAWLLHEASVKQLGPVRFDVRLNLSMYSI